MINIWMLLVLILSYLIGSINFSIIICRIKTGKDIRNFGSGNAGATNTLRTLGKGAGISVLILDVLKTVAAALISISIYKGDKSAAIYMSAIGTVLGHNYPVWFGFKGGKGIAVSAAAVFLADWKIGLAITVFSLLVMAVSKYVSLGSISGAALLIILALIFKRNDEMFIFFSIAIGILAIYRHKENIKRLLEGKENKLSLSKKKEN